MSRTRIGIVGAGFMGTIHAAGWATCADAELTAVLAGPASPPDTLARRYGMRACDTLAELLELVDVVDVCAPTDLHLEITLAAAAAGRAVICEKPLARTPDDGERMIAACRDAGVPLLVGHVVRFFPEYSTLKEAVDRGDIGDPAVLRFTRATFQPKRPAGNWFADERRSGGLALDLMIHDLDYARWVGGEVSTVYARSLRAARPDTAADHVLAILRHRSGAISHVEASWAFPPPVFRTRGEVAGTTGVLTFDSDRTAPVRPLLRTKPEAGDTPLAASPLAETPYATELKHFLTVLRDGAKPIVTAEDGLAALRIATAVVESIGSGRAIDMEVAA
ncbi:Gfo/Idh/MocA family protein [Phytoactinopolyspora limicola]|uniref:Gfo/Idh/MocA family protein n=1 Tax=Phytoactinopolyspora limicola TaxID=2715536 RepID=UPI00140D2517|nr:Gfo/Idh/MocA family oxidoreductase [Phytoactinopolyspora limicola]